jgi:uncharacterized membrane protein YkoI
MGQRVSMNIKRVAGLLLEGVPLLVLMTTTAFALSGARYESQTKITLEQARAIALKTCPGRIDSEELEKESGGSGLRYSFVISNKDVKHEVGVDAKTGEILENSVEGPNAD